MIMRREGEKGADEAVVGGVERDPSESHLRGRPNRI